MTKLTFFRTLCFLLLVSSLLPVVANNIPSPLGSFRFLWAPIWLFAVTFFKSEIYSQKYVLSLLLYGLISIILLENILWVHMIVWYKRMILEEFYALVLALTVLSYFIISRDYIGWAKLSKWALIIIAITGMMTVIATAIDPTVARNSANSFRYFPQQKALFDLTGCGGYGFGQSICILLPILIYNIKFGYKSVLYRRILIFFVVFLLFVQIRIQYFANIFISFVIIGVSLLGQRKIKTSIIIIVFSFIIATFIPVHFYADILVSVSKYFDIRSENYSKVNSLASYLVNPEADESTDAVDRIERYPMLFKAFSERPVLGDASYKSIYYKDVFEGGHLHWMSRLTIWGIFGFLFYLFVLLTIFKRVLLLFDKPFAFYYLISVTAFILLGLLKTIGGRENWIMLLIIIPGLYFSPLKNFIPATTNH